MIFLTLNGENFITLDCNFSRSRDFEVKNYNSFDDLRVNMNDEFKNILNIVAAGLETISTSL